MKRHCILSFCLLILFLAGWTLNHVVNTHNHPPVYVEQLNSFVDNSVLIALDKEVKKLPLLLGHCLALILHHRPRLFLGPVFYQSNNVIP